MRSSLNILARVNYLEHLANIENPSLRRKLSGHVHVDTNSQKKSVFGEPDHFQNLFHYEISLGNKVFGCVGMCFKSGM